MTVINTNVAASITANALTNNERSMSQAMERLSTGQRINSASDDAAGLAIASRMTSQINGLNMAVRNANDAISLVQTADGALVEVSSMLQRMRELAVQAASGTYSSTDKTALDTEYDQLRLQIQDINDDTQWNGTALLSGGTTFTFHVGANASQTVAVAIGDFDTDEANASSGVFEALADATSDNNNSNDDLATSNIDSAANTAIGYLDEAISRVNEERAKLGAAISRLEYASDNLANISQNTSASRSRVLDADYATETTELARTQIIQQAATAMLSQANQYPQTVLALLK
jgi:flagellin